MGCVHPNGVEPQCVYCMQCRGRGGLAFIRGACGQQSQGINIPEAAEVASVPWVGSLGLCHDSAHINNSQFTLDFSSSGLSLLPKMLSMYHFPLIVTTDVLFLVSSFHGLNFPPGTECNLTL